MINASDNEPGQGDRPADQPRQPARPSRDLASGRTPPPSAGVPPATGDDDGGDDGAKKEKKKKKNKKKKNRFGTSRGIETMFRTSYRTHIDMSSLADSKANIMISINGLIMSILIASISPKIDTNAWLLLPTSVLLVGCLVSMVYAVLAARPRVTNRTVSLEDVRSEGANILFFGNFVNMPEEEYAEGMQELLQNPDSLYLTMIRDIYSLGRVLAQKFHYLRISYAVFMLALVVGVCFFLLVLLTVVIRTAPQI